MLAAFLIISAAGAGAGAAVAAAPSEPVAGILKLIMVEERGCRYCLAWEREVGTHYDASAEGRRAPVERVPRAAGVLDGLKPVVYTPTFILMRGKIEVGRITGYPGAAFFWEELRDLLQAPAAGAMGEP